MDRAPPRCDGLFGHRRPRRHLAPRLDLRPRLPRTARRLDDTSDSLAIRATRRRPTVGLAPELLRRFGCRTHDERLPDVHLEWAGRPSRHWRLAHHAHADRHDRLGRRLHVSSRQEPRPRPSGVVCRRGRLHDDAILARRVRGRLHANARRHGPAAQGVASRARSVRPTARRAGLCPGLCLDRVERQHDPSGSDDGRPGWRLRHRSGRHRRRFVAAACAASRICRRDGNRRRLPAPPDRLHFMATRGPFRRQPTPWAHRPATRP